MDEPAFVLIAHGAREASWALPLFRVRNAVAARVPGLRVELAFLELMPPGLAECVEKLAAEGFGRILVVPLFIARGGHLTRDVPRQLDELRRKYPGVAFDLAPPVGEAEAVVQAMAGHVLDMAGQAAAGHDD